MPSTGWFRETRIINKPIVLMHASHRGDDMLEQLRLVLSTVSQQFSQDLFLRFEVMKMSPKDISNHLAMASNQSAVAGLSLTFVGHADVLVHLNCFRNYRMRHSYLAQGEPSKTDFEMEA